MLEIFSRARGLFRALLPALLAAAAGAALAQAAEPALVWHQRAIAAHYWTDPTGKASLEAARAAFDGNQGRAADPNRVMPLGGGVAIWYRLRLPAVPAPARAVFTVTFPGTDSVELFRPDPAGGWRGQRAGDRLPVGEWPMPYLHPAFAFTLQPDEAAATYLRVQHTHPIRVDWVLWDANGFSASAKAWHLALGVYVGFMVLVLLLSVVNTFSWRDPIHVYYAVHVLLVGLSMLALTGLAGEYLWPNNAWWNDKAPVAIPAASLAWAGLFVRELVAERGARLVSWSLLAHTAVGFVMAVGVLLIARENFFRAPSLYLVPGMALVLGVLAWYTRRRPKVGVWVLGGMTILAAGSLWPLFRNLGLIDSSFMTEYGPQLGGALEIPLVLVGLYFRGRERRDSRVRLEALSHTDPLTGLGNHRVLMARLTHLLRRAQRDPSLGAVLRVHVSNLDAIRDEYGREAVEAATVRAAECVARGAIEGDTVARERGGDLVLVMEGQVSRGKIAETGRNIIARGLKFSRRLPRGVTLGFRVAAVCAPLPHADAAVVLAMLERAIVEIGNDPLGRKLRILMPAGQAETIEDSPSALFPSQRRA